MVVLPFGSLSGTCLNINGNKNEGEKEIVVKDGD
jgi:hypothetical protein